MADINTATVTITAVAAPDCMTSMQAALIDETPDTHLGDAWGRCTTCQRPVRAESWSSRGWLCAHCHYANALHEEVVRLNIELSDNLEKLRELTHMSEDGCLYLEQRHEV